MLLQAEVCDVLVVMWELVSGEIAGVFDVVLTFYSTLDVWMVGTAWSWYRIPAPVSDTPHASAQPSCGANGISDLSFVCLFYGSNDDRGVWMVGTAWSWYRIPAPMSDTPYASAQPSCGANGISDLSFVCLFYGSLDAWMVGIA